MGNVSNDGNGSSDSSLLRQNCRENWPDWTCTAANICGLVSTAIWFIVLLPQVWKNFRRKSVRGLSVLWATANFTASLINLFFVFLYVHIPLYGQISSVYSPVLEITMLGQFVLYGHYRRTEIVLYIAGCCVLWATLISVEVILNLENYIEYVAIALWCVETFPQVILNMKLQSTNGQATSSVIIAMVGKTTDFLSNGGLRMPIHYVIMVYFSSSVAYINGLQVAWYYGNDFQEPIDQSDENIQPSIQEKPTELGPCGNAIRWICIVLLCLLLMGCVAGFCLNIGSYYGLFAPVAIAAVLGAAKGYLLTRRSSFSLTHHHGIQSVHK